MLYWIESPATNNVRYTISLVFVIQMRLVRTVDPVDVFIREIKIYISPPPGSLYLKECHYVKLCVFYCVLVYWGRKFTGQQREEKKKKGRRTLTLFFFYYNVVDIYSGVISIYPSSMCTLQCGWRDKYAAAVWRENTVPESQLYIRMCIIYYIFAVYKSLFF